MTNRPTERVISEPLVAADVRIFDVVALRAVAVAGDAPSRRSARPPRLLERSCLTVIVAEVLVKPEKYGATGKGSHKGYVSSAAGKGFLPHTK